jgi:hypothetical protein
MDTRVPFVRISASIRLIYAMFRLYADIETGFGKAIIDILKKQYPDQNVTASPASVGHKMMAIAKKQNQQDPQRSMDALQDFLTYISTGSEFEKNDKGEYVYETDPETGKKERVPRRNPSPWNFRKDFDTWEEALNAIYSNIRLRGITHSKGWTDSQKKTKDIDKAFGTRPEGGGAPEGGEGKIPTPTDTPLGKALDDKAAIKEFIDLIDSYIPELKASLTPASRALFELVFDDNIGSFGSDVKENMGQASALKDKLLSTESGKKIYEANAKRWAGFVGDTRKKLLNEIWSFIDKNMTPGDYEALRETFFSDTSPRDVKTFQKKKEQERVDYQRGLDERKYGREKWKDLNGLLDEKGKKSFKNLEDKLKKEGVDVSTIEAVEPTEKEKKGKSQPEGEEQSQVASSIASRVAARWLARAV